MFPPRSGSGFKISLDSHPDQYLDQDPDPRRKSERKLLQKLFTRKTSKQQFLIENSHKIAENVHDRELLIREKSRIRSRKIYGSGSESGLS